jgi:hypothetical protein
MDKVEFPAYFGVVCGARAAEDILPQEAFLFIPNKLILNVQRARDSDISDIFKNHDSLFVANVDRDFLILVLSVIYERQQGDKSFWHPYLDIVNPGIPACYWNEEVLKKVDC